MATGLVRAGILYDGTARPGAADCAVVLEGSGIAAVLPWADRPDAPLLAEADIVTPGLIDLQINGGGGLLFNDAPTVQTVAQIARAARTTGAAYILPTFITDAGDRYRAAIDAVAGSDDPGVLGLHLEGPFLSAAKPGIHPADAIRGIAATDLALIEAAGIPVLLTMAPEEIDPTTLERLAKAGIVLFAGHTNALSEDIARAEAAGLRGATHLFNAMRQMTARDPGVVGAVFASNRLFAGLIADGIHVAPASVAAAYAALGPARLFLVSDAMPTLGSDIDGFDLLGTPITRADGRLTGPDGTLAGADLTLAEAILHIDAMTGCGLAQAVQMASQTPAQAMGFDRLGRVAPGYRAGLSLFSDGFDPQGVVVDGLVF